MKTWELHGGNNSRRYGRIMLTKAETLTGAKLSYLRFFGDVFLSKVFILEDDTVREVITTGTSRPVIGRAKRILVEGE